jgi:hypothetical protein
MQEAQQANSTARRVTKLCTSAHTSTYAMLSCSKFLNIA